jgi:hypothetical protein
VLPFRIGIRQSAFPALIVEGDESGNVPYTRAESGNVPYTRAEMAQAREVFEWLIRGL